MTGLASAASKAAQASGPKLAVTSDANGNIAAVDPNELFVSTGAKSTAIGSGAMAGGTNGIALGVNASAAGDNSCALGAGASATATGSCALGSGSTATNAGATAIGMGASTIRANEIALGTAANTVRAAGIPSAASTAAQSGRLGLVTTDANGNLASDGGKLQATVDDHGTRITTLEGQTKTNTNNINNLTNTVTNIDNRVTRQCTQIILAQKREQ